MTTFKFPIGTMIRLTYESYQPADDGGKMFPIWNNDIGGGEMTLQRILWDEDVGVIIGHKDWYRASLYILLVGEVTIAVSAYWLHQNSCIVFVP